jgi:hypothetical protein
MPITFNEGDKRFRLRESQAEPEELERKSHFTPIMTCILFLPAAASSK